MDENRDLMVVKNSPAIIQAFIEDYLETHGPKAGKYRVTRIRGNIDTVYWFAARPGGRHTELREVKVEFDVEATDAMNVCNKVELHVAVADDGMPIVDHLVLRIDCLGGWYGWEA